MTIVMHGVTLESVQIGSRREYPAAKLTGATGIFKGPVAEARIEFGGLVGDAVVDTKNHGGPDQAVYVYSREDYAPFERSLGRALPAGQFGENLTFTGMTDHPVRVGDRFHVGDHAVLEVTSPRIPCAVFAAKMEVPDMVARFRAERRPGFYCRVIVEGKVAAGDAVMRVMAPDTNVEILELFDLFYDRAASRDRVEAALASPIAIRAREDNERRLNR